MARERATVKEPESLSPVFARAGKRDIGQLRFVLRFLKPYRGRVALASLALVIGVVAVLAFGPALRRIVDMGFDPENVGHVNWYFLAMFGVVVLLAAATAARFALVSWLGERVVADIREAVYSHVITLSPAFFEENRSGEIASRLTADTTLIQSVVGSSFSVAIRSALTVTGGLIALGLTNLKLTLLVLLAVPLVLAPILLIGRSVRNLSRASQDRIADIGATVTESFGATQTIQAFTHEAADRVRFQRIGESAFSTAARRIKSRASLTFLIILLAVGAINLASARRTSRQRCPSRRAARWRSRLSRFTTRRAPARQRSIICRSACARARPWHWSARPAPASPPCSSCCFDSTIRRGVRSASTASTWRRPTRARCAGVWASCRRIR